MSQKDTAWLNTLIEIKFVSAHDISYRANNSPMSFYEIALISQKIKKKY